MAKIVQYPNFPDWRDTDAQEKALKALIKQSDSRPLGKGSVVSQDVADGRAWYVIEKLSPFTLAHIDYMDGYRSRPFEDAPRWFVVGTADHQRKLREILGS
jgi:hypothetical protein